MRWSVEDGKRGWLWKQSSNEVRLSIGRAAFGTQQAQEVLIGITVVIAGKIFRAVQTEGVCVGGGGGGWILQNRVLGTGQQIAYKHFYLRGNG